MKKLLLIAAGLAQAVWGQAYQPAPGFSQSAAGRPVPGLSLAITTSSSHFPRGAPLLVQWELHTPTDRPLMFLVDGLSSLKVSVSRQSAGGSHFFVDVQKTAKGKQVLDPRPNLRARGTRSLPKGIRLRGELDVSSLYDVSQPGTYRIVLMRYFEEAVRGHKERVVSNELLLTVTP